MADKAPSTFFFFFLLLIYRHRQTHYTRKTKACPLSSLSSLSSSFSISYLIESFFFTRFPTLSFPPFFLYKNSHFSSMHPWDNKPIDHHRHPSFSSTLLDQIYRSIDVDTSTNSDVSMRKKNRDENRAIADDFVRSRNPKTVEPVCFKHSSTSSSDSSGSESDSFYKRSKSISHPKPIRTTVERSTQAHRPNSKQEHGSFLKTKSKALKIYSDLKKVKQPISPGGRLSTFLNSIFTGVGNTRKPSKINTTAPSTTCSTASSYSRSCLSKTPSSSEKRKRSVRFCPLNEESSKRCGHNNKLYGNNERESTRHHQNLDTVEIRVMEENRRVIEAAKELLRTYQKKTKEEENDSEDALSCASSDLFELDNLSAIGIER